MTDDTALLERFTADGDEAAFAAIVSRHLPMVFGVCFRRTGNRELSEELTQNVFTSLAKKASSISANVSLSGWLHRAASFECSHALRTESNRTRKMKQLAELHTDPDPVHIDADASEVSRQLDQSINQLTKKEQDMVLMRFSEELTLSQIGGCIGKSESATQRHLSKVLEKLASILRRRGVTTSALALTAILSAEITKAAPAGLSAASISKAALTAATTSQTTLIATIIMTKKTATITAGCLLLTVAGGIALKNNTKESTETTATPSSAPHQAGETAATKDSNREDPTAAADKTRTERTSNADAELIARYGESRVKLSRHIANRIIHLNDLIAGMKDIASSGGNGNITSNVKVIRLDQGDLGDINLKDLSDPEKLRELTDKAKESAGEESPSEGAPEANVKVEEAMAKMRDAQEKLKEDSTPLQEELLAADAVTRGEMTEAEYEDIQAQTPQQKVFIGGIGETKPRSLVDTEKMIEKQIKTMEAVNSLIDLGGE
ncbi:MAG: sigma-70 family RNA polymerase sigma factor [Akkermansiaceae bacterium]|jgi:RNA polymerase sigma factor (sigma-70 family)|nr:sigma-70 family RNA polymerase sigma factor [Akkermansiaceae bacterium]MDP4780599.1 sigma-70 family RNA polymerase sigma factor [Akkermansiaceae bacterium]MDP4846858.1 sigma-70 family RNA polymerase sigma factor [Akkermansiaceae bacterium]